MQKAQALCLGFCGPDGTGTFCFRWVLLVLDIDKKYSIYKGLEIM